MEDILASIRRIIADDQSQAGRSAFGSLRRGSQPLPPSEPGMAEGQHSGPEGHDGPEDVLDLARLPEAVVPDIDQPAPSSAIEIEHAESRDAELYVREDTVEAIVTDPPAPYMNGYAIPFSLHASVDMNDHKAETPVSEVRHYPQDPPVAAPSQIQQTTIADNDPLISPKLGASVMSAFETLAATVVLQNSDMLDRVMHELMRPLLKSWLDENLPAIVERLVRLEIERVARGAG